MGQHMPTLIAIGYFIGQKILKMEIMIGLPYNYLSPEINEEVCPFLGVCA